MPHFLSPMETMEVHSNTKMFLIFTVFQVIFVAAVHSTQIKGVPASSKYNFESMHVEHWGRDVVLVLGCICK